MSICIPIRADIFGRLGLSIESPLIHHGLDKAKAMPKNDFY